jgi:hypothetical protein
MMQPERQRLGRLNADRVEWLVVTGGATPHRIGRSMRDRHEPSGHAALVRFGRGMAVCVGDRGRARLFGLLLTRVKMRA